MRISQGQLVPLGYGKYARSERIVAIEPIEDGRGPGRRTRVWVEGVEEALIASRSEAAIMADMVEDRDAPARLSAQRELLGEVLDTVERIDPVLRRIVRDQGEWNLDRLEERIRQVLVGGTD